MSFPFFRLIRKIDLFRGDQKWNVILIKTLKTVPAHTPVKKKVNAASVLPITNQEMKFQAVSSAQQQKQNMTVQLNISSVHLLNKTNILNSASFEENLVLK